MKRRVPFYIRPGKPIPGADGSLWATYYIPWWGMPVAGLRSLWWWSRG